MARLLYSLLIYLLLPLMFIRLWLRGRQSPAYRSRWSERLALFTVPSQYQGGICFHCVSVGEAIAATSLIKQVQQIYPNLPIVITTTTPTGSAQVTKAFGDSVFHVYLPFDAPGIMSRFLHKIKPKLVVIIETELWPNLLHYCHQRQIKTLLANARLSAKSALGYRRIGVLTRQMLKDITLVAAHDQADADRFLNLGLDPHKLAVTGSIKFDIHIDPDLIERSQQLKQNWAANRRVWVVGSTHQGEDELILGVYQQVAVLHPDLLLIIVPRHPERFNQVAQLIDSQQFVMSRRSLAQPVDHNVQVVLGDTMGELLLFWSIADIAFVGGSLIKHGGHNPLEPCSFMVPVLSGPHVYNFKHIYQMLVTEDAVWITENPSELQTAVLRLLDKPERAKQLGINAANVIHSNRGALDHLQQEIDQLL